MQAVPPWVAAERRNTTSLFLNSGLMMGYAGFLRAFMKLAYVQECVDDQVAIRQHFLANVSYVRDKAGRIKLGHGGPGPLIELDYFQDLMANLYRVTLADFEVERGRGRLVVKESGGEPCILHQPGCKGCGMDGHALEDIAKELRII